MIDPVAERSGAPVREAVGNARGLNSARTQPARLPIINRQPNGTTLAANPPEWAS